MSRSTASCAPSAPRTPTRPGDPSSPKLRYALDRDWSGDDAIHFTGILRDPVGREFYELEETSPIREQVYDLVRESGTERIPYLTFQLESERRALDATPDDDDSAPDDSSSSL